MSSAKLVGKNRPVISSAGKGGKASGEKRQMAQIKDWLDQIERSRAKAESYLTEIERFKAETRALLTKLMAA